MYAQEAEMMVEAVLVQLEKDGYFNLINRMTNPQIQSQVQPLKTNTGKLLLHLQFLEEQFITQSTNHQRV